HPEEGDRTRGAARRLEDRGRQLTKRREHARDAVHHRGPGRRIADQDPGHSGDQQDRGNEGEERGVRQASGDEATPARVVPRQNADGGRDRTEAGDPAGTPENAVQVALSRRLVQSPSSSNRRGWMSPAFTRRDGARSALTSPRRTKRRPPSLMLCSLPDRAQAPIVEGRNRTFDAARIPAAS